MSSPAGAKPPKPSGPKPAAAAAAARPAPGTQPASPVALPKGQQINPASPEARAVANEARDAAVAAAERLGINDADKYIIRQLASTSAINEYVLRINRGENAVNAKAASLAEAELNIEPLLIQYAPAAAQQPAAAGVPSATGVPSAAGAATGAAGVPSATLAGAAAALQSPAAAGPPAAVLQQQQQQQQQLPLASSSRSGRLGLAPLAGTGSPLAGTGSPLAGTGSPLAGTGQSQSSSGIAGFELGGLGYRPTYQPTCEPCACEPNGRCKCTCDSGIQGIAVGGRFLRKSKSRKSKSRKSKSRKSKSRKSKSKSKSRK